METIIMYFLPMNFDRTKTHILFKHNKDISPIGYRKQILKWLIVSLPYERCRESLGLTTMAAR